MPTARAHGLEVWLCTLVTAPAPETDTAAPATHGPRPLDTRCALNAPPPPPSLPGRVHWVVYPAAPQAREMSCDRPARRCITSVDDRRCERGHPHTALGLGLRAATRVASLPTWVVTGGCRRSGHAPAVSSGRASPHGEALMGRGRAWAARFTRQPHAIAIPSPSAARMRHEMWPCMQARCGASDVALRLHRQPDLAAERCMSAAINELYEPSSSPDDIEAWELVKDLAARSTFI